MASVAPDTAPAKTRSAERWLITGAVMASVIMELMDTSAVNVSLPYVSGNLAATLDEST